MKRTTSYGRGERLRDQGMGAVADKSNGWVRDAVHTGMNIRKGWIGDGEDLRHIFVGAHGKPHHPNCIGTATMILVKYRKILVWTGELSKSNDSPSHARMTKVYRRV